MGRCDVCVRTPRRRFPAVYESYKRRCKGFRGAEIPLPRKGHAIVARPGCRFIRVIYRNSPECYRSVARAVAGCIEVSTEHSPRVVRRVAKVMLRPLPPEVVDMAILMALARMVSEGRAPVYVLQEYVRRIGPVI